jgi:hypothetical protein
MSITVITAVLNLKKTIVPPHERLVLYCLAWHADEHGLNAWPNVDTIARETSMSKRGVQYALRRLKDKGLIFVHVPPSGRSVNYGVKLEVLHRERYEKDPAPRAPVHRVHPTADPHAPDPSMDLREPGAPGHEPGAPGEVNVVHLAPAPGAPDPSVNRPSEPSLKKYLAASRPAELTGEHDDEDEDDDDDAYAAATRIAHTVFDELGDSAPSEALAKEFVGRLNGRTPDRILNDVGWFLWSVKQERQARRTRRARATTYERF